jgi:hypothetical protein
MRSNCNSNRSQLESFAPAATKWLAQYDPVWLDRVCPESGPKSASRLHAELRLRYRGKVVSKLATLSGSRSRSKLWDMAPDAVRWLAQNDAAWLDQISPPKVKRMRTTTFSSLKRKHRVRLVEVLKNDKPNSRGEAYSLLGATYIWLRIHDSEWLNRKIASRRLSAT